jgi:hypothetical protein
MVVGVTLTSNISAYYKASPVHFKTSSRKNLLYNNILLTANGLIPGGSGVDTNNYGGNTLPISMAARRVW